MTFVRWADIRNEHVDAIGEERVEAGKERLRQGVRAYRLRELRERKGFTQRQVAQIMGVSVGRVSQIERGDLAGVEVLERYVTALGGRLDLVANFGDEQVTMG